METVSLVLILLVLAAFSGLVVRAVPALPLPLVQVALGALLAWPKGGVRVTFEPDVFLLVFIPPPLFADAWRPRR